MSVQVHPVAPSKEGDTTATRMAFLAMIRIPRRESEHRPETGDGETARRTSRQAGQIALGRPATGSATDVTTGWATGGIGHGRRRERVRAEVHGVRRRGGLFSGRRQRLVRRLNGFAVWSGVVPGWDSPPWVTGGPV